MLTKGILTAIGAGLIFSGVSNIGEISKQIRTHDYAVQGIKAEIMAESGGEIESYRKAQYAFSVAERKLDETKTKDLALMVVNPDLVPKELLLNLHSNVANYISAKSAYETLKASTNRIAAESAILDIERRERVVTQGLEDRSAKGFMYAGIGASMLTFVFLTNRRKNQTQAS